MTAHPVSSQVMLLSRPLISLPLGGLWLQMSVPALGFWVGYRHGPQVIGIASVLLPTERSCRPTGTY